MSHPSNEISRSLFPGYIQARLRQGPFLRPRPYAGRGRRNETGDAVHSRRPFRVCAGGARRGRCPRRGGDTRAARSRVRAGRTTFRTARRVLRSSPGARQQQDTLALQFPHAHSGPPGGEHAPHRQQPQPALHHRRRGRSRQDDRGGAGHQGAHLPARLFEDTHRRARVAFAPVAARDGKQVQRAFRGADRRFIRRAESLGGRSSNPWQHCGKAICSLDFIKNRSFGESLASCRWDAVIFDEAHRLRRDSQRSTLAYTVAEVLSRNTRSCFFLPRRRSAERSRALLPGPAGR